MKYGLNLNKAKVSINWNHISDNLVSIVWQLLITSIIFYLISHFGKKIINHYADKTRKKTKKANKRTQTLTALFTSVFHYTVIFFYLFSVLSILGLPVGTLLASAGIFSLALGMGAQGFVSDLVNGFFILSEDQFDVGDTVMINNQVGVVKQLGLRTTKLTAADGSTIFIPNRNISIVQNIAHNSIGLTINLTLDSSNNFEKVKQIIEDVNQNIVNPDKRVVTKPVIVGVTAQNGDTITYTVTMKVRLNKQNSVKNLYLSNYIEALQKNDIKFA